MRVHFDVLGWLYVLVGATGVLAGVAFGTLAMGTVVSLPTDGGASARLSHSAVWLLLAGGLVFTIGGLAMVAVGRALGHRRPNGRRAALAAALANLVILPFGTALGVYTFWALINDEARREFGRPVRRPERSIQSGS